MSCLRRFCPTQACTIPYVFVERWPPKANVPPISLLFNVASKFILNKGTGRHVRKLVLEACKEPIESNGAMIWGHHCPIHGERAMPLDRAAAAAHVDCCVLCVCLWLSLVVFCVWE
jgi:hypothetical protein